jgi:magnesium chelatase accessory protein
MECCMTDWTDSGATVRSVVSDGLRWRVLQAGSGPVLLLLHGSGATIHTWHGLLPLLVPHFSVVAPDLPGHGGTELPPAGAMGLPGVAGLVAGLLRELHCEPRLVLGHSAGLAIAARMTLDGLIHPAGLAGVNPALSVADSPVPGLLAPLVNPVARSRTVARLVALFARQPGVVEATLRATGSAVPDGMLQEYRRHAGNPAHVHAVLTMMSHWNLTPLARDLRELAVPLLVIVGDGDRWIAPASLDRVVRAVPQLRRVVVPGTGHLTHEEKPEAVFRSLIAFARGVRVVPGRMPGDEDATG